MAQWPNPGNFYGADVQVNYSVSVSGVFNNIGELWVPAGETLSVTPFDGTTGGLLEIHCRSFILDGTLDASGAGYGPGGGGGGGAGGYDANGSGPAGAGGPGYDGGTAGAGGVGGSKPTGGMGGDGGHGGGTFGGPSGPGGGNNGGVGGTGGAGGYLGTVANNDYTTDDSVAMGSAGGGGGGGGGGLGAGTTHDDYGGGGGGGGCGAYGGGIIRIYASKIRITGALKSEDRRSGNGGAGATGMAWAGSGGVGGGYAVLQSSAGGPGGRPRPPGYGTYGGYGGNGGRGAGGGIVIYFDRHFAQITPAPRVVAKGVISNVGGLGAVNGGTVKVFTHDTPVISSVAAGRVLRPDAPDGAGLKSKIPPFGAITG